MVLLVGQVSKPIALMLRQRAVESEFFRYCCSAPAQYYNSIDVKLKMKAMNLKIKGLKIGKLSEQKWEVVEFENVSLIYFVSIFRAVELGANVLSEFIVIFLGTTAALIEMNRKSKSKKFSKELQKSEKANFTYNLKEVMLKVQEHNVELKNLSDRLEVIMARHLFVQELSNYCESTPQKRSKCHWYFPDSVKQPALFDDNVQLPSINHSNVNLWSKKCALCQICFSHTFSTTHFHVLLYFHCCKFSNFHIKNKKRKTGKCVVGELSENWL